MFIQLLIYFIKKDRTDYLYDGFENTLIKYCMGTVWGNTLSITCLRINFNIKKNRGSAKEKLKGTFDFILMNDSNNY